MCIYAYRLVCDATEAHYGFQVVLDRDQGSGILVFRSVVTNVGKGYDSQTGYFTTKTNGIFVFTWYLESYAHSAVVTLEVNDEEITTTQTQVSTFLHYSGSSFAILNLNREDTVGLRLINGTANKAFTMFNGWKQSGRYYYFKYATFYWFTKKNNVYPFTTQDCQDILVRLSLDYVLLI